MSVESCFRRRAATYGQPDKQPIEETAPNQPTNPYGQSKLAFEQAMRWYRDAYGLRFAALRYFNAAGASENCGEDHADETHIIPIALRSRPRANARLVEVYGDDYPTPDGTCVRDYIHVIDLARAHTARVAVARAAAVEASTTSAVVARVTVSNQVLETAREVTGREAFRLELAPRRAGDPAVLIA